MNDFSVPDFGGTPLDNSTISQDRLNIHDRSRTNLFPWNGQFSPQLVEEILKAYSSPGNLIFDPFVGSGTVLYEAGRSGCPAFGTDVNPAACKMADIYQFMNYPPRKRTEFIGQAENVLNEVLPGRTLFSAGRNNHPLEIALSEAAMSARSDPVKSLLDALIVLLDYSDEMLMPEKVRQTWNRLRNSVLELPISGAAIQSMNCDARAVPLPDGIVNFVMTSPPYINVFNYHQNYRRSVESLGYHLLTVAKSEIGSNRRNRQNRFLTVVQYCLEMAEVFNELRRLCSPQARIVIVLGRESMVRKTRFFNGEIIARLAVRTCGCKLHVRQERVFQNRFGGMIYEDILHFTFDGSSAGNPADVARQTLQDALNRAPAESLSDLREAILRIDEMESSPVYGQPSPAYVTQGRTECV